LRVRVSDATEPHQHVASASQGNNMERAERKRPGSVLHAARRCDGPDARRKRSWCCAGQCFTDRTAATVQAALLGYQPML